MGKIAASYADHGYITSDNPRKNPSIKYPKTLCQVFALKREVIGFSYLIEERTRLQ